MEENRIYRSILGNYNDILDAAERSMVRDDVVEWLNTEGGFRDYQEGRYWEYINDIHTIHIKDSILTKPARFCDKRPAIRPCIYEDIRCNEKCQETHVPVLSWMVSGTAVFKKNLPSMSTLNWTQDDLHVMYDMTLNESSNTYKELVLTYFGDMNTNIECKDANNLECVRTLMIQPIDNDWRIENLSNLQYILPNTSFRDVRFPGDQVFDIKTDSFTGLKANTIIVSECKLLYDKERLFEDLINCDFDEGESISIKLKKEWSEFIDSIAELSFLNPDLYYIKTYIPGNGWEKNMTDRRPVVIDIKQTADRNELVFW